MKLSNNHSHFDPEKEKHPEIKQKAMQRLSHIRRKMSRGASNIFRMIKTRSGWGNKQLWGHREQGKGNLPTDKSKK